MQNKKLIRFVESLVILPMVTMSGPVAMPQSNLGPVSNPPIISSQKLNIQLAQITLGPKADPEADAEALELKTKGDAIDAYFAAHDMPLEGSGEKMAEEAEKNGLDWRLVAAIAVRESTGGKHDCEKANNNPFGWGSCKISFKSVDDAIETIATNLGGNNPNTAGHYDNKTTKQILQAYNPPSVVPRYAEQVMSIMNSIGSADITSEVAMANS